MSTTTPTTPVAPRDPSNDAKPDYSKPRYADQIQGLMMEITGSNDQVVRAARTRTEAIEAMQEVWEEEHQEAVDEWEDYIAQVELDEAQAKKVAAAAAKKKVDEAEAELEKGRPKMPAYVRGQMVKSSVPIIISKFAREKVKARKFCELYYFTPEGVAEARRSGTAATSVADADGGVDIGNGIFIKTGGNQPSKKAVPDAALAMSQVSPGMALWIQSMMDEKYDTDHVAGWVDCKLLLENETQWRHSDLGDALIVRYLAEIRYEWFNWINGSGDAFDLAMINEERMRRIQDELMRERLFALQKSIESRAITGSSGRDFSGSALTSTRGDRTPSRRGGVAWGDSANREDRVFRRDADPTPPVCVLCEGLGCSKDRCVRTHLWDGTQETASRKVGREIILKKEPKTHLCFDWNTAAGCRSKIHGNKHACSGCGKRGHGAQQCYLREKA